VVPASSRLLSWDVLRVIGILAVLVFHATLYTPLNLPGIDRPPWMMQFPFGASLLLTVSGFFAAMTIGKHPPLVLWLRRLARLLPAFLFAVLFIFAFARLFAPADFPQTGLRDLAGNLALVHVLVPSISYVDIAHWTVPVQVAAFTGIALLAAFRVVRGRVASAVLWALLVVPLLLRWTFMGDGDHPPQWLSLVMDGTGVNRAHLFIAGVAIYRWSTGKTGFSQLYLMLTAVVVAHQSHPPPGDSVVAYALALVLICVAAHGPDWDLPILRALERPIRWLGGISYGVYLMHMTIGSIVARRLVDIGLDWWVWVPAFVATAIALGWLLTRWVEQPAFRMLTRRWPARSRR
jgi:peptidoglycan/LPS O-acetylase OafA/YrhL